IYQNVQMTYYLLSNDSRLAMATRDFNLFTANEPTAGDNPSEAFVARPVPKERPTRELTPQELAALSGRAELTYGSAYSGRIYNGNNDLTITEVVAEITTTTQGKKSQKRYTAAVTIPPFATKQVTFDVFVNQGTDYSWSIVKASGIARSSRSFP